MATLFGIPLAALSGQLLLGLINGAFYAILSLGLALIFGMLNIINFAHGAQFMMGAFVAWLSLTYLGLSYWWALLLAPLVVGIVGIIIERTMLCRLYKLDHLYGLLLTFGISLLIEGFFRQLYGVSGMPYAVPEALMGGVDLGVLYAPIYRLWVVAASVVVCIGVWLAVDKTRLGAYLRAATENPTLVRTFGINVPVLITLTYGIGVALAGFAGVLAAPIYSVNPLMGSNLIIVVFAVVVIGGMGSILGSVVTGFGLGILEGLTKVIYPEASSTVIFLVMAFVLLVKPAGLFGKETGAAVQADGGHARAERGTLKSLGIPFAVLLVVFAAAPFAVYPIFLMKALCFAMFACAFNLMIGYGGLLSFGHAAFFGMASYISAYTAKQWGFTPELSILAAALVAAGLGAAIGGLAIRRQGIYFSMITLALAQMVYFFCLQAPFTNGEDGIQSVPRGHLFGLIDLSSDMTMYYFVLAMFALVYLAIVRIVHSPFGRVLSAVKGNEPRAVSLGYEATRYKFLVFVFSATLAGVAGATKALALQLASLTDVFWSMSGEVVLMSLIGGLGTLLGPVAGAFFITGLQNYMAQFGAWVTIIQGLVFIVCVLVFRRGIVGEVQRWGSELAQRQRKRGAPAAYAESKP
ncbi:MAG: branched-chain amino acid ABC transporter permease [Pseudomonadota bacterium]